MSWVEETRVPGAYTEFFVEDPKRRRINALPFSNRVVSPRRHRCGPHPDMEAYVPHDSFACIKGKGTHVAVRRLQRFMRRHPELFGS